MAWCINLYVHLGFFAADKFLCVKWMEKMVSASSGLVVVWPLWPLGGLESLGLHGCAHFLNPPRCGTRPLKEPLLLAVYAFWFFLHIFLFHVFPSELSPPAAIITFALDTWGCSFRCARTLSLLLPERLALNEGGHTVLRCQKVHEVCGFITSGSAVQTLVPPFCFFSRYVRSLMLQDKWKMAVESHSQVHVMAMGKHSPATSWTTQNFQRKSIKEVIIHIA